MAGQTEKFDPYQAWLGVPPDEHPPSYYRLLGLDDFESDQNAIIRGAERTIRHVQSFQTGRRAAWSERLLDELVAARSCLLDLSRKEAYDKSLQVKRGIQRLPQRACQAPNNEAATAQPKAESADQFAAPTRTVRTTAGRRRAKKRTRELVTFVMLLAVFLALVVAAATMFGG